MTLMNKPTHDPKLTRWWWRTLREWIYELVDPLWGAFRGENEDDIALTNVTGINGITAAELAALDGLTTTTGELNQLAGLTAVAAELNKVDRTEADGLAEASKAQVLDANRDILGTRYDPSQSLLDCTARGPACKLDGSTAEIAVADHEDLDFGTGDFSIIVRAEIGDYVNHGSTYNALLGKAAIIVGPGAFYALAIQSDNRLAFILNAINTQALSDSALNDGQIHYITGVRSGGTIQLFVDGRLQAGTGFNSGTVSSTSALYIGSDGSPARRLGGVIFEVLLFNRALAVGEIRALASGRPIWYRDQGASQGNRATNGEDWTGASGSTPPNNWSDSGSGTATYIIRDNSGVANFGDDKALELNASGGSKTLSQSVSLARKRYHVSFVYRNLEGSTCSTVALGSDGNQANLQDTGITGDGVLFEQEFIADGTDLKFFVDSSGTLQVDHVAVVQLGCVAEFSSKGITPLQWLDENGGGHHGDLVDAEPVSLPSSHVMRFEKTGITGDTTLSSVVPPGYRIKSMVADVTGAGSGMLLNVGTSTGGSDVVNGQDISSNDLFDLTLSKRIFSLNSGQDLYVNDDGGTAWSGVNINLYLTLERLV
ncbi:LamG domain-containing protein [Candidatus Neomarinimicrobiota bacterium]